MEADDVEMCKDLNTLFCNVGEVVGASSFSVGHGANPLKKVASVKMLNQASEVQNIAAYPLRRTVSRFRSYLYIFLMRIRNLRYISGKFPMIIQFCSRTHIVSAVEIYLKIAVFAAEHCILH